MSSFVWCTRWCQHLAERTPLIVCWGLLHTHTHTWLLQTLYGIVRPILYLRFICRVLSAQLPRFEQSNANWCVLRKNRYADDAFCGKNAMRMMRFAEKPLCGWCVLRKKRYADYAFCGKNASIDRNKSSRTFSIESFKTR